MSCIQRIQGVEPSERLKEHLGCGTTEMISACQAPPCVSKPMMRHQRHAWSYQGHWRIWQIRQEPVGPRRLVSTPIHICK